MCDLISSGLMKVVGRNLEGSKIKLRSRALLEEAGHEGHELCL